MTIVTQLDIVFDHITGCNQWIKELGSEHEKQMAEKLETAFLKAYDDMMLLSANIQSSKPNQAISDAQLKVIDNFKDVCQAIIDLTNTSSENSKLRKIAQAQRDIQKANSPYNRFRWWLVLRIMIFAIKIAPSGKARSNLIAHHRQWSAECLAALNRVTVTEVRATNLTGHFL